MNTILIAVLVLSVVLLFGECNAEFNFTEFKRQSDENRMMIHEIRKSRQRAEEMEKIKEAQENGFIVRRRNGTIVNGASKSAVEYSLLLILGLAATYY